MRTLTKPCMLVGCLRFFRSLGSPAWLTMFAVVCVVLEVSHVASEGWLAVWSENADDGGDDGTAGSGSGDPASGDDDDDSFGSNLSTGTYMAVYALPRGIHTVPMCLPLQRA